MSAEERALNLAKRKRNSKVTMCEETISEIEKGIQNLKTVEEDEKEHMLAMLVGSKLTLIELKKELVPLADEYICLVEGDEEAEELSRVAAQLYRRIQGAITAVDVASAGQKASQESGKSQSISVKLPKLEIKKFSGNPSQWRSFWDSFQAAVGKHSHIEDVEKFNFLKGLLEGKAAMAISGLELSNENYKEAVALLSDRFGSKQVVITHHMDTLLQIVQVKAGTDVKQLRAVYDKIEINVRGLQSLGIKPDQYGCLLVPVIMSKVPEDIRLIILRQFSSENWTFEVLLKCFKQELEAREKCVAVSKSSSRKEEQNKRDGDSRIGSSSRALVTKNGKENSVKCTFCRDNHLSVNCDIVTDVNARWSVVKRNNRCFLCLGTGHGSRECSSQRLCKTCNQRHHISLCKEKKESNGLLVNARSTTLLQTATVKAVNPESKRNVSVRVVFDLGSNDSYITLDLKDKLGLKNVGSHRLRIAGFGGASNGAKMYPMTCLKLRSRLGGDYFPFSAFVVPKIASSLNPKVSLQDHEHLFNLELADDFSNEKTDIDVLVGVDQYHRFVSGETKRGSEGPVATKSVFGWLVSGPVGGNTTNFSNSLFTSSTRSINENLSRFWNVESLGIENDEDENKKLLKDFKSSIVHNGERYEVPLPRKDIHESLPDNLGVAKQRFSSLKKRLDKQPEVFDRYNKYFSDQLEKGVIEKVQNDDKGKEGWTHYLPHHCVVREDRETTKLRVVFDASCRVNNSPSLNRCLNAGPSLNPELFDILLRFRMFPIALLADIEKAFHMISVRPEDRDVMRFVWVDDEDPEKTAIYRQTRLTFGVNASPFILTCTIKKHLEKFVLKEKVVVELIEDSLYVDDMCTGEFDEDTSFSLYKKAKAFLKDGSFNLRKWRTNSRQLENKINECEKVGSSQEGKVLGIPWDSKTDTLEFELSEFGSKFTSMEITKRKVVSVIAQLFDPLGLLSPIFISAKVLLQEIHKSCIDWDSKVGDSLVRKWQRWLALLKDIGLIRIPRFYFKSLDSFGKESMIELHGFSDASALAYGAVIYVVDVQTRKSVIVTSKTRVAPLKSTSIPRLELLGAVVLSRLISRVCKAFSRIIKVEGIYCWTDSMVVLHWMNIGKELKQFVRNRIKTIKENSEGAFWRHCPGKENPADLLSRGVMSKDEFQNGIWFQGPSWLSKNKEHWPKQSLILDDISKKVVKEEVKSTQVLLNNTGEGEIIDFQRFSKYNRLIRSVAWVLRFCHNTMNINKKTGCLGSYEVERAELVVLKCCQAGFKKRRIDDLEKSLRIKQNENGLLETVGRLEEGDSCGRIIVFRESHLAILVVLSAHEKVKHLGTAATLAELRSRFWITKGRQFVKKVLKMCLVCKKAQGTRFPSPNEGSLPNFRISSTVTAFENIGLDYLGPLYVVSMESGKESKIWVSLFTCAVSRAIHLEIINDMTTDAFLNCFRRFCARRGIPSLIVSDNAKTFKAANKFLVKLSEDVKVMDHLSSLNIKWQFILEKSPWWGGFWERMVKLTKESLKKTLGKTHISLEGLQTVLTEIEAVINCRPLTYVGADDVRESLTPSHLVCGKRIIGLPSGTKTLESLSENYSHIMKVLSDARDRWYKEYLTELRCHHRHQQKKTIHPEVGDLVLVDQKKIKRQNWKVGRVTKLIIGRKDIVRGAVISFGAEKAELRRPLELLYPLEVQGWDSFSFLGNDLNDQPSNNVKVDSSINNNNNRNSSVSFRKGTLRPIIPARDPIKLSSVSDKNRTQQPIIPARVQNKALSDSVSSSIGTVTHSPDPVTSYVSYSPCPVKSSPDPVTSSPGPVSSLPFPVTSSPGPVSYSPDPDTSLMDRVSYSPHPVTSSTDPVSYSPSPVTSSPGPVSYSPDPVTSSTDRVSYSPDPVTSSPGPVSSSPGPVSYSPGPVTSLPDPVSSSPFPVTSSPGLVSYSPGPVTSSSSSVTHSTFPITHLASPFTRSSDSIMPDMSSSDPLKYTQGPTTTLKSRSTAPSLVIDQEHSPIGLNPNAKTFSPSSTNKRWKTYNLRKKYR